MFTSHLFTVLDDTFTCVTYSQTYTLNVRTQVAQRKKCLLCLFVRCHVFQKSPLYSTKRALHSIKPALETVLKILITLTPSLLPMHAYQRMTHHKKTHSRLLLHVCLGLRAVYDGFCWAKLLWVGVGVCMSATGVLLVLESTVWHRSWIKPRRVAGRPVPQAFFFGGCVLLCFIDPRVRKIRNDVSRNVLARQKDFRCFTWHLTEI